MNEIEKIDYIHGVIKETLEPINNDWSYDANGTPITNEVK